MLSVGMTFFLLGIWSNKCLIYSLLLYPVAIYCIFVRFAIHVIRQKFFFPLDKERGMAVILPIVLKPLMN